MLFAVISLAVVVGSTSAADTRESGKAETKYLAFQLFTGSSVSRDVAANIPPSSGNLLKTVTDLRERIGTTGTGDRKLGFILGPLSFDDTDEETRDIVEQMFDVSLRTGVACGLHMDDSMFWGRLAALDTADAIEWTDWNGTPTTGRRLDWSTTPSKIMPQLCFNSVPVKAAVAARAALIGEEVAKGIQRLKAVDKESLFIGIIAGWETQIGRDYDTGKQVGFHALANEGFSASNPPADIDRERVSHQGQFRHVAGARVISINVRLHPARDCFLCLLYPRLFNLSAAWTPRTMESGADQTWQPRMGFQRRDGNGSEPDGWWRPIDGRISRKPVQSWRGPRESIRLGCR
jgi:hypothetical protein